jgi:hypothetical protein
MASDASTSTPGMFLLISFWNWKNGVTRERQMLLAEIIMTLAVLISDRKSVQEIGDFLHGGRIVLALDIFDII